MTINTNIYPGNPLADNSLQNPAEESKSNSIRARIERAQGNSWISTNNTSSWVTDDQLTNLRPRRTYNQRRVPRVVTQRLPNNPSTDAIIVDLPRPQRPAALCLNSVNPANSNQKGNNQNAHDPFLPYELLPHQMVDQQTSNRHSPPIPNPFNFPPLFSLRALPPFTPQLLQDSSVEIDPRLRSPILPGTEAHESQANSRPQQK